MHNVTAIVELTGRTVELLMSTGDDSVSVAVMDLDTIMDGLRYDVYAPASASMFNCDVVHESYVSWSELGNDAMRDAITEKVTAFAAKLGYNVTHVDFFN